MAKKGKHNWIEKGEFFEDLLPLTDAQRSFVSEWYPWAMKYANTEIHRRKEGDSDVPESIIVDAAISALIYSAYYWNPDGGASFKTFFHRGFSMRVWNAATRHQKRKNRSISENTPMPISENLTGGYFNDKKYLTLAQTSAFSQKSFEETSLSQIYVDELISKLTPLQQTAVRRCWLDREKQTDVARDLGVTKQAINQALNYAKKNLVVMMMGEEKPKPGARKKEAK